MDHIYDQCCRYQGRVVNIRCRDGHRHVGRIVRVTRRNVYIEPSRPRSLGGFGLGYWGGFAGYGYYRPYAIPLAFITGLAVGLLFW